MTTHCHDLDTAVSCRGGWMMWCEYTRCMSSGDNGYTCRCHSSYIVFVFVVCEVVGGEWGVDVTSSPILLLMILPVERCVWVNRPYDVHKLLLLLLLFFRHWRAPHLVSQPSSATATVANTGAAACLSCCCCCCCCVTAYDRWLHSSFPFLSLLVNFSHSCCPVRNSAAVGSRFFRCCVP